MSPLATVADVEARLSSTLTDGERVRVAVLIDDATAAVRAETRQWVSRATTTERLRIKVLHGNPVLTLPQRPTNSITSITDIYGNAVTWQWQGFDTVVLLTWKLTTNPLGVLIEPEALDVTYDHGYDDSNDTRGVLDTVRGIIAGGIVARAFGTPSEQAGKTAESIGTYSYSIGPAAAQGSFGLLRSEKQALRAALGTRTAGSIPL